jgi:DNA replicative helicase MCM subunit Mcm2 (Cdc46/Mcm family)
MDYIRELRYVHLGKLIKSIFLLLYLVRGVVTIRTEVFNQLKVIFFRC